MADCCEAAADTRPQPTEGRVIENVGVLDWRSLKDKADLANVAAVRNVGTVLITEALAGAVASIPMQNVGMVVPVPVGDNISVQVGDLRLSGESLADGPAEGILVLIGDIVITSPVTTVGWKEIRLTGQLLAPKGSEAALGTKMTQLTGQVLYYPYAGPDTDVRTIMGNERIGAGYLKALTRPQVLIAVGNVTFEEDVTADLLRERLVGMVAIGNIVVDRDLAPAVQALCLERVGNMRVYPKGARRFEGDETLGPEDFEYLPDASVIVIDGQLTILPGVTKEMVKGKLKDIVLAGRLIAPRALLALLRSLISQKDGQLVALEDEEAS